MPHIENNPSENKSSATGSSETRADAVAARTSETTEAPGSGESEPLSALSVLRNPAVSWLADHSGVSLDPQEILGGACERLVDAGVPLQRVTCILDDAHPQIDIIGIGWRPEQGPGRVVFEYTGNPDSEGYLASPIKVIDDGGGPIRRPLHRADCPIDFPVLEDRRQEGATDYLAAPLIFSDGSPYFISFTTENPGGFTDHHLALLQETLPLLSMRLEIERRRNITTTLLRTYLGKAAAERIEQGRIRRFQCEAMYAIIVCTDLRDFTTNADRLPPHETIRLLGIYHETVAKHFQDFGGDIVKIIADSVLAIFPIEQNADQRRIDHVACGANTAVRKARESLEAITAQDLPAGVHRLRAGFALHAGEVAFGNVGAPDRLDFTVIGAAVNEVVRVEALTKQLGEPVLATATFAGLDCSVQLKSIGFHRLRGVRELKELFRPVS